MSISGDSLAVLQSNKRSWRYLGGTSPIDTGFKVKYPREQQFMRALLAHRVVFIWEEQNKLLYKNHGQ